MSLDLYLPRRWKLIGGTSLGLGPFAQLLLLLGVGGSLVPRAFGQTSPTLSLNGEITVDRQGIFLSQVASQPSGASLPAIRIGDAPKAGQSLVLSRERIAEQLRRAAPGWETPAWTGPEQVRVSRRMRTFEEADLALLLTATLQTELVRDRGQLELRLTRPWRPVPVPDEPLTLKVTELPANGLTSTFVAGFELLAGEESLGRWQTTAKAQWYREVYVARSSLLRGQPLRPADFAPERRDILLYRDVLAAFPGASETLELAESLPAGAPLCGRSVQPRPVVHRGEMVEALLIEGPLSISLKVEALDNGAPGQSVRVRNVTTRKEFRGKVRDEQTVLVLL